MTQSCRAQHQPSGYLCCTQRAGLEGRGCARTRCKQHFPCTARLQHETPRFSNVDVRCALQEALQTFPLQPAELMYLIKSDQDVLFHGCRPL